MHEVLVNRLGGRSLPRKSVVRLTDRPDMALDVYRGRKTTTQQQQDTLKTQTNQPICGIVGFLAWKKKQQKKSTNRFRNFSQNSQ